MTTIFTRVALLKNRDKHAATNSRYIHSRMKSSLTTAFIELCYLISPVLHLPFFGPQVISRVDLPGRDDRLWRPQSASIRESHAANVVVDCCGRPSGIKQSNQTNNFIGTHLGETNTSRTWNFLNESVHLKKQSSGLRDVRNVDSILFKLVPDPHTWSQECFTKTISYTKLK